MISAMTWLKTIHVLQPWALMFSVCSEESFISTCFKSISAAIFNTCELVCLLLYVFKCPHVQNLLRTVQPANIKPCRLNILYQIPASQRYWWCVHVYFHLFKNTRNVYIIEIVESHETVKNMHNLYFTPKVYNNNEKNTFCLKKYTHIFRTIRFFYCYCNCLFCLFFPPKRSVYLSNFK